MGKRQHHPLAFLLLASSTPAFGQVEGGWLAGAGTGNFFVCVIAGILLAFAFHFLITNLAVAMGISAVDDVRDAGSSKSGSKTDSGSQAGTGAERRAPPAATGVKITSGLGVALTVSMAVSLFFASWIAVRLSLIPDNYVGIALGLVIWAGYLLIGLWLEAKMVTTFTGSVISAMKNALGSSVSAMGSAFSGSRQDSLQRGIEDTMRTVEEEVRQEFDLSRVEQKLDEYVDRLAPQETGVNELQQAMMDLLEQIEVREEFTPEDPEATRRLFLEVAERQKGMSAQDKQKFTNAFDQAREAYKSGSRAEGGRADQAMAAAEKMAPGGEEQARQYREKVAEYLRQSGRDELNPDTLKQDLERILNDPAAAPEVVQARASQIDRSTLRDLLATRDNISEEQAEQYLNKAEEVLQNIRDRANQAAGSAQQRATSAREAAGGVRQRAASAQSGSSRSMEDRRAGAERAIAQWFDRMNRPELQYARLKQDVQQILDDPKVAPAVLRNRLRRMDRDSLVALMSNNPRISRDQAERAVDSVEQARDEVIRKADEMERQVENKLEAVRDEALRQAEATRRTAATASWWLFTALVVSGVTSALGGMLAITV